MISRIQQGVLILIKSALNGKVYDLPEGFSIQEAANSIYKHQIVGMAYEGAILSGIDRNDETMQKLFRQYCNHLIHSENQMRALGELFAAFEKNNIDYLPVKGSNMKLLYPNHAMRIMGDADILIRMTQYDQIEPIMVELGYTAGHEMDHEIVWDCKALHVELHKRLIPSDNTDYYRYIGEGWLYAEKIDGNRYSLSNEIMYVFLLLHFAKHFRGGGIGIRQAIDLWVYEQKTPIDPEKLTAELTKANILEFYHNIRTMLACWFEDRQWDERSEFISEFLFASGSWGTMQNKLLSQGLKGSKKQGSSRRVRTQMFFEAIFPSLSRMKTRYPVLEKHPILLPVFYPVRWVSALLFRRNNIRNYANNIHVVSAENVDTFEKSLKYVGLDLDI